MYNVTIDTVIKNNLRSAVKNEEHICPTCHQLFTSPEELNEHLENLEIQTEIYCTICKTYDESNPDCNHEDAEKKLVCSLCKERLECSELKGHLCFHDFCHTCFRSFPSLQKLYGHVKVQTMCMCQICRQFLGPGNECNDPHTAKVFYCDFCGVKLDNYYKLPEHLCFHGKIFRTVKSKKTEEYEDMGLAEKTLAIEKNREKEMKKRGRQIKPVHIYNKVKQKYFLAKSKYLEAVKKIRDGYYNMHPYIDFRDSDDSETENKDIQLDDGLPQEEETTLCVFCCEEISLAVLEKHESKCTKRFVSPYTLTIPSNLQTDLSRDKKVLCYFCGKLCQPEEFRNHKATHKKIASVLCEICGLSTRTLRVHMTTHSDKKNYSCEVCGMLFRNSNRLSVHKLVHTKVRKYKCTTCEKRFKTSFNLRVHMRSHMDKKPFECGICNKSFTTKQWRDNHLGTHK